MTTWDERFREGEYPTDPDPSPVLERYVDTLPEGRALDIATGTGRNAVFLAREGYRVEAIDQSRVGLEIARENAETHGVAGRTNWIQADVPSFAFPEATYDVITISFYRAMDRLGDIKDALADGGVLFVEHHLRTNDPVDVGPSGDRYRFGANELLHACLDLTVLYFDATTEQLEDGRTTATARIIARNTTGREQSYPEPER
ncbi:class I SAM-dependent methyltransferase [Halobellus ordinarius]|uniref:class I SAM-dependent methyltransferase n=1 Tax=Halobellus ordinarius TaxID=3075120 RepID=UPI002880A62D|nr:methyltransferase domain-containing protein [Halobellus sp. ZY16]